MDRHCRRCHDGETPQCFGGGQPDHLVMSIPHGPIDLLLAAALSLLIAALATGSVFT
jgi:hypothetical protein